MPAPIPDSSNFVYVSHKCSDLVIKHVHRYFLPERAGFPILNHARRVPGLQLQFQPSYLDFGRSPYGYIHEQSVCSEGWHLCSRMQQNICAFLAGNILLGIFLLDYDRTRREGIHSRSQHCSHIYGAHTYIHAHTHTHTHTHARTHAHTYRVGSLASPRRGAAAHTHTYTHTHTNIHARTHMCTHAYTHTGLARLLAPGVEQPHTHAHTHMCTHAYTHAGLARLLAPGVEQLDAR